MNDIHPPDVFRLELKGFSTNDLGHGPWGVFQKALKIMDQLPVLEPVGQLPGLEQKIRIVRTAVLGLFGGEGFINIGPLLSAVPFSGKGSRGDEGSGRPGCLGSILPPEGFSPVSRSTSRKATEKPFPSAAFLALARDSADRSARITGRPRPARKRPFSPSPQARSRTGPSRSLANRREANFFSKGLGATKVPFFRARTPDISGPGEGC